MAFQAIAPLIQARRADGSYVHVYEGAFLPEDMDQDQLDSLLADGAVEEADAPDGTEQPAANAAKKAWVAYALANGHDEEEIAPLTRDDIRALFAEPDQD